MSPRPGVWRRRAIAAAALAAVGLTACSGGGEEPLVASVAVGGFEMGFTPSRLIVHEPGRVALTFTNDGTIPHTFVIEGRGFKLKAFDAGETASGTVTLPDGAWFFYCDIRGHREAGMEGELFVGDTEIPPATTTTMELRSG